MVLRKLLWKEGLRCDEANNGRVAFEKYKTHRQCGKCEGYKLILMDLQMPIMDGIEATQRILTHSKAENEETQINIIAVTAYVTTIEKEKCLNIGMSEILCKPIDTATLSSSLHKYYIP